MKESKEKLGTKIEKEENLDPKLEELSNEVRDLYSEDDRDLWREKRRLLRGLVNEKIESIKEGIKEDDQESLIEGLKKIAMTKFLYLWQPGMYNHTTMEAMIESNIRKKEGLISSKFAKRARLKEIIESYPAGFSRGVSAFEGWPDEKYKDVRFYLWGQYWEPMPPGEEYPYVMGFIFDPVQKPKTWGKSGEAVFERVAPRSFLGILLAVSNAEKLNKPSKELRKKFEDGLSRWVAKEYRPMAEWIPKEHKRGGPELAIPIVSPEGHLLWPKCLNKFEVLSIVGDKEDKEFAKEKLIE